MTRHKIHTDEMFDNRKVMGKTRALRLRRVSVLEIILQSTKNGTTVPEQQEISDLIGCDRGVIHHDLEALDKFMFLKREYGRNRLRYHIGRLVTPWAKTHRRNVPEHENKAKTTTRNCMCCSRKFESDGIHNRLCGNCKTKSVRLL